MNLLKQKGITALTVALFILVAAAVPRLLSAQELKGGEVWDRNCNRCHNYRVIRERTDRQWKLLVNHMRVRANLSGQEAKAVLKYLQEHN
jgi:cytochrome c1